MMQSDIPLKCACGKLRGSALGVSPSTGNRVVCYCGDCQAFARFLGRPDITDQWGGTDIYQMPPSRVRISSGEDVLSCMRLSPKGLLRWYCGACKTPVGNTVKASMPFVGLIHNFMDHAGDGRSRDEVLGKPAGYVWMKTAIGTLPDSIRKSSQLRIIARSLKLLGKWWLTGAGSPSPFFDERTGAPRAEPRVLTLEERRAL